MFDHKTGTNPSRNTDRVKHDSPAYYARALQPVGVDLDPPPQPDNAVPPEVLDRIFGHSSEHMEELPDRSIHLMITSPPYNVGKEYDSDLSLDEYRGLLRRVLDETYRVLVDGGRACINVANLGRKPYIPLHSYVIQEASEVGFWMRGEIIWDKGPGAGTSTAWGSWCSPSNPTLRDTHEYILIFQKPPYWRSAPPGSEPTLSPREFLTLTKSVWKFGPESAKRVEHPAPFPVELPQRLIQLYSYSGDVVLDPFMGSGTTAVAAKSAGRRYVGYEVVEKYARATITRLSGS
jgi:site-specific DNA-methyltransferase (adenine-specific)